KPVELVRAVRLSELFHTYQTEFTVGAKEVITRAMEDIHMKHVSRIIGGQTLLASVTAGTVQRFVDERSQEQFNGYPVMPAMPIADRSPPIVVGIKHTSSATSTVMVIGFP